MGFTKTAGAVVRSRQFPESLFDIRPVRHRTNAVTMQRCGPMVHCLICGAEFQAWNNSQAANGRAKYCSMACRNAGISAHFHTPPSTKEQRVAANAYVNGEIAAGRLQRAEVCSECPSRENVDAHHDDYSKPDEFRWLCRSCHMEWHFNHKEVDGASAAIAPMQKTGARV